MGSYRFPVLISQMKRKMFLEEHFCSCSEQGIRNRCSGLMTMKTRPSKLAVPSTKTESRNSFNLWVLLFPKMTRFLFWNKTLR